MDEKWCLMYTRSGSFVGIAPLLEAVEQVSDVREIPEFFQELARNCRSTDEFHEKLVEILSRDWPRYGY
jgi:hypothetical protein